MTIPPARTEDQQVDSTAPAQQSADEGLICLECEYNLSGLTQDRCPECGTAFDRQYLRLIASSRPQLVSPWDERDGSGYWLSFWRTCLATWLRPADFARQFPARHSTASAWKFSLTCYGIASLPFVVLSVSVGRMGWLLGVICVASGALSCEVMIALVLKWLTRPTKSPRKNTYHFWRGLTHFTSNYLLLSMAAFAVIALVSEFSRGFYGYETYEVYAAISCAILFAFFMYWWMALGRAVLERARAGFLLRLVITLLIPVVGWVSIFVGYLTGMLIALTLYRF